MHTSLKSFAAIAAGLIALAPLGGSAEEVYFDTISTAKATRMHGAYFGIFGGGSSQNKADFRGAADGYGFDLAGDSGWLIGAEIGYSWKTAFPIRPSVELEGMYLKDNNINATSGAAMLRGDVRTFTGMANGIIALDLDQHRDDVGSFVAALHPYVGAGLGVAATRTKSATLTTPQGTRTWGKSTDASFAYQLFAGLEVDLTERTSIYGEYKYLVIDELASGNISDYKLDLWTLGLKVQY